MEDKQLTEAFLARDIAKNKSNLERDFNKNFETQEKTLSIITSGLEHSNFNSFSTASIIWNLSGYINLTTYDLKIITRDLTFAEKGWQRKLYARQSYLLIYESMNDLLRLLGKQLLSSINGFSDAEHFKNQVKSITVRLNIFKNEYESTIKSIRNTVIAHRDNDILTQLQSIKSIEWSTAIHITIQFSSILNDLGGICQRLMNRSTDQLAELGVPKRDQNLK